MDKLVHQIDQRFQKEFKLDGLRSGHDLFHFLIRSRDDLFKVYKLLNNLHKYIQFTIEANEKELPFLEVLITMENTNISSDFVYKKTVTSTSF